MGIGDVFGKGNDAPASERPPEDGRDRRAGTGDEAGDGVPREEIPDHVFPALAVQDDADDDLSYIHPIFGKTDHTPESEKTVTRIEVPVRTIVTVALSLFLIWLLL